MKTLRLATTSMIAVLALTLTGCGSADSETPVKPQDQEADQFLKYVKCLKKQGLKASYTQGSDGRGHFDVDAQPGDPKFRSAQRACSEVVPQELDKSVSPDELDGLIKVAACMRKQGIEIKDPTVDDPALHISGGEKDSKKAEEIKASCEKKIQGSSPAG